MALELDMTSCFFVEHPVYNRLETVRLLDAKGGAMQDNLQFWCVLSPESLAAHLQVKFLFSIGCIFIQY